MQDLKSQIVSILNKVTLNTTVILGKTIIQFYTGSVAVSNHDVTTTFAESLLDALIGKNAVKLYPSMILPYCVLCKAIQLQSGNHSASTLLKAFLSALDSELAIQQVVGGTRPEEASPAVHNLSVLFALLFNVHFVDGGFMASLCEDMTKTLESEKHCEVLYLLLQHSGEVLRREQNSALLQDVFRVIQRWSEENSDSIGARHTALLDFVRELRYFHQRKKLTKYQHLVSAEEMTQVKSAIGALCAGKEARELILSVTVDKCRAAKDARWWLPTIPEYQLASQPDPNTILASLKRRMNPLPDQETEGDELPPQEGDDEFAGSRTYPPHINTPYRKKMWDLFRRGGPSVSTADALSRIYVIDPKGQLYQDLALVMFHLIQNPDHCPVLLEDDGILLGVTHRLCSNNREFRHQMQVFMARCFEQLGKEPLNLKKNIALGKWAAVLVFHQKGMDRKSTLIRRTASVIENMGDNTALNVFFTVFFSSIMLLCSKNEDILDCFAPAAPSMWVADFVRKTFVASKKFEATLPVLCPAGKGDLDAMKTKLKDAAQLVVHLM
eukprot:PhF_6_TR11009/c0_g1_i1/m.17825